MLKQETAKQQAEQYKKDFESAYPKLDPKYPLPNIPITGGATFIKELEKVLGTFKKLS